MSRYLNIIKSSLILAFVLNCAVSALIPNPLISRNKAAYTSGGTVTYLTDNKYGSGAFSVKDGSWIAINVGIGASKVFLSWNDPNYAWASTPIAPSTCANSGLAHLTDYNILTSSNSTNGADGDWKSAVSIKSNMVTARGHKCDFTDASWIKLQITTGSGTLDEVEVFDISNGAEDIWFFPGTSISANTYKGNPPSQNFADLITKSAPAFTPAMIRAGVGCQNSTGFAENISTYVEIGGNAAFWAIEHGTNDAWNGTNGGVATFKKNMQTIITACKAAGAQPVIARMIATNAKVATWQVHKDFLTCIDDLTKDNNLIAGPDLYTYFVNHPEELSATDGVHPTAAGGASIQRLWAEKMADLYKSSSIAAMHIPANSEQGALNNSLSINGRVVLRSAGAGTATVFALDGRMIQKYNLNGNVSSVINTKSSGSYILRFVSSNKTEYFRFISN